MQRSKAAEFVCGYLEKHGVADEALAAGVEPQNAAKTLALRDGDDYRLAVLPASRRLDLDLAREALRASVHLRLASESEMQRDFAVFEIGALPPFGPLLPAPEIVDPRVLQHDRILCSAGDHSRSLLI